ncbi:MAG: twin-arginine translocase subunit TatC [Candidatus Brocadiia bacterium]
MEEKHISLGEHLDELRKRLIYSAIFFSVCLAVCFIFQNKIMEIICCPHFKATNSLLKAFGPAERFVVYFKAVMIASALMATPFALYQLWKFISAGLYEKEKKYVLFYAPFSLGLFVAGVLFGYYLFIPPTLKILYYYGDNAVVESLINFNEYFSVFVMLTLLLGLVFELPLLMLFLVQIKIINPKTYTSQIKAAILIAFILAAIITPTGDPITQTLVAVPLLLLYGLGIVISFIYKYKTNRLDKERAN